MSIKKLYHTKEQALTKLASLNNDIYHLFSSDKNCCGAKYFHLYTYENVYNIVKNKNEHYYENYDNNKSIKFFMDIDFNFNKIDKNDIHFKYDNMDDFINVVLTEFTNIFSNYGYNNYPVIVQNASTDIKASYHIIFPTIIFKSCDHIKDFMNNIQSNLIKNLFDLRIIDPAVYRTGCLRLLHCSKFKKQNKLKFYKSYNYNFISDEQIFMDSLLLNFDKNINVINYDIKKVHPVNDINQIANHVFNTTINNLHVQTQQVNTVQKCINTFSNDVISLEELQKLLDLINIKNADNYETWIRIGSALKNSNPDSFNLWVEWSKMSPKFKSDNDCLVRWNSLNLKYITIGTLKWFAKTDSPKEYSELYKSIDEQFNVPSIKINQEYLLNDIKKSLNEKSCVVSSLIDNWICSNNKCFVIKSPYGTGKTQLLIKLIREYGLKRVLYISYRKTLSNSIFGSFYELQFEKYTDKNYSADKFICQVDSLLKIVNNESLELPSYDLVIFDEVESILNHFNAKTLKEKEDIFDYMIGIANNSKKCIMLDGDISNRAFTLIKNIGSNIFVENIYPKLPKHFIFTENKDKFDKEINDDLKNGKKIVIVGMSSELCLRYNEMYKEKYKVCVYTSNSDDEQFKTLINVNNYWTQFDLVMYSPTIESGVDFNEKYFDKMYCMLSSESTSQRGFLQMCARIRYLKNNNIMIYLNHIPYYESAHPYTYSEAKQFFLSIYNKYNKRKIIINPETKKSEIQYENSLFNEILIYNILEKENKNSAYFVPILLNLMKSKSHTYELDKNVTIIENNSKVKKSAIIQTKIINAQDINQNDFDELLIKQNASKLIHEDKIKMERFIYKKTFKTEIIDEEFMKKYYRKIHVISNIKYLFKNERHETITFDEDYKFKFSEIEKLEQKTVLLNLINTLGFNLEDIKKGEKKISKEEIEKVIETLKISWFSKYNCQLFGLSKKKIDSIRSFMGTINSIFDDYGIKIIYTQKKVRISTSFLNTNNYVIVINDNFKINTI